MRFVIAAGALMAASTVAGAASPVLGLPLGGPFKVKDECPIDARQAKEVCWIGPPRITDSGGNIGAIYVPDPDSRPLWAAYARFKVQVAADGMLESIELMASGRDRTTIAQSISTRFGTARENSEGRMGSMKARWVAEGIEASLLCLPEDCYVSFNSPRYQARLEAELAERKRINAARPVAP